MFLTDRSDIDTSPRRMIITARLDEEHIDAPSYVCLNNSYTKIVWEIPIKSKSATVFMNQTDVVKTGVEN
jgi:hypothetical protein